MGYVPPKLESLSNVLNRKAGRSLPTGVIITYGAKKPEVDDWFKNLMKEAIEKNDKGK